LRYIVTLGSVKEVAQMRGIAKLLFGDDAGRLLDLFGGDEADGFGMADRARRSGEWCGSTPGHVQAADAAHGATRRGGIHPGDLRREVIIREYRTR
jgi:hypothetical protein